MHTGHPHAGGNGTTVGGLEKQLVLSTILEKKMRVIASSAGPKRGLTSWELARPSSHEASLPSWQSLTQTRKVRGDVLFFCWVTFH